MRNAMARKQRRQVDWKDLILFFSCLLFFTLFGLLLYRNIRSLEEEQLAHSARNLAVAAARILEEDGEGYASLSRALPGSLTPEKEGELARLQEIFRELKKESQATFLYTLKETPEGAIYILVGEDSGEEHREDRPYGRTTNESILVGQEEMGPRAEGGFEAAEQGDHYGVGAARGFGGGGGAG